MTPSNIKAFLDDLARISLRHGFKLSEGVGGICIDRITPGFEGYSARVRDGVSDGFPLHDHLMCASNYVDSIDIIKLSNHERLKISLPKWRDTELTKAHAALDSFDAPQLDDDGEWLPLSVRIEKVMGGTS